MLFFIRNSGDDDDEIFKSKYIYIYIYIFFIKKKIAHVEF
jgi:hypothetical protein